MKAKITHGKEKFEVDLSKPMDVSLPMKSGKDNPNAWHAPDVKIEPVIMGDWVGEVKSGAPVNFRNIFFNPHGSGTHTESVGHISKENFWLNDCLKNFFFLAELISVKPEKLNNGDRIISKKQIAEKSKHKNCQALLLRTLPNDFSKRKRKYTETNPPYLHHEATDYLRKKGIKHLLVDLPSVDKEHDGGKLAAHHAFWNYPSAPVKDATITEFIFVPVKIRDGKYFLNIQIANFENDASPSKILLFKIKPLH